MGTCMKFVEACVRAWTRLYTWGLPVHERSARRDEIESDLWESARDTRDSSARALGLQLFARLFLGIADDILWRWEHRVTIGEVDGIAPSQRISRHPLVTASAFTCSLTVHLLAAISAISLTSYSIHQVMPSSQGSAPSRFAASGQFLGSKGEVSIARPIGEVHAMSYRWRPLVSRALAGLAISAGAVAAQQNPPTPPTGPVFEVASIKPNPTGNSGPTSTQILPGGRFVATNIPLRLLIGQTYRVSSLRLVGGPSWIESEHFDIEAKADSELFPKGDQRPLDSALRALLADRFKLVVHTESRQMPIYTLVRARSDNRLGPNLIHSSRTDCEGMLETPNRGSGGPPPPPASGQAPPCGARTFPGSLRADSILLSFVAGVISGEVNRTVVDRTGLTGRFNVQLTWTPDQIPQRPPGINDLPLIDPNGPSIFTAVQEQLGLKLESATGPVDVLVIDSVVRPTPN